MRYLTYLSCSSLQQRFISWNSLCFKVKFTYPNIVIPILSVFCSFHFPPATPNEKSSTMFLKSPKNYDVSFFPPQFLTLSIIIIIIITIIIIVHCQWLPLLIFRVRAKACPAGNCQSRQGLVLASRLTSSCNLPFSIATSINKEKDNEGIPKCKPQLRLFLSSTAMFLAAPSPLCEPIQ